MLVPLLAYAQKGRECDLDIQESLGVQRLFVHSLTEDKGDNRRPIAIQDLREVLVAETEEMILQKDEIGVASHLLCVPYVLRGYDQKLVCNYRLNLRNGKTGYKCLRDDVVIGGVMSTFVDNGLCRMWFSSGRRINLQKAVDQNNEKNCKIIAGVCGGGTWYRDLVTLPKAAKIQTFVAFHRQGPTFVIQTSETSCLQVLPDIQRWGNGFLIVEQNGTERKPLMYLAVDDETGYVKVRHCSILAKPRASVDFSYGRERFARIDSYVPHLSSGEYMRCALQPYSEGVAGRRFNIVARQINGQLCFVFAGLHLIYACDEVRGQFGCETFENGVSSVGPYGERMLLNVQNHAVTLEAQGPGLFALCVYTHPSCLNMSYTLNESRIFDVRQLTTYPRNQMRLNYTDQLYCDSDNNSTYIALPRNDFGEHFQIAEEKEKIQLRYKCIRDDGVGKQGGSIFIFKLWDKVCDLSRPLVERIGGFALNLFWEKEDVNIHCALEGECAHVYVRDSSAHFYHFLVDKNDSAVRTYEHHIDSRHSAFLHVRTLDILCVDGAPRVHHDVQHIKLRFFRWNFDFCYQKVDDFGRCSSAEETVGILDYADRVSGHQRWYSLSCIASYKPFREKYAAVHLTAMGRQCDIVVGSPPQSLQVCFDEKDCLVYLCVKDLKGQKHDIILNQFFGADMLYFYYQGVLQASYPVSL